MKILQEKISFKPFIMSTRENFPAKECLVPYAKEASIFHSPNWYECVIGSLDFPKDGYMIDYCKPYVCVFRGELYFGWDKRGISNLDGDFWPNIENPVRNENYVVIAFRKVSYKEIEDNMKIKAEIAKHGIESQIWED